MKLTAGQLTQQMSTIDDGYDSEAMAKIEANIKSEVEASQHACFKQIDLRIRESGQEIDKQLEKQKMSTES